MSRSRAVSKLVIPVGLLVSATLVLATGWSAQAQQPPTPPPRPAPEAPQSGDVLWTFAPELPFADGRVAAALGALVDAELRASGIEAFYAEERDPQSKTYVAYRDAGPAQPGEVKLLLTAAGFPDGLVRLREVGPCRVWASAGQEDIAAKVAGRLKSTLNAVGAETDACTPTQDQRQAHLLVWQAGGQEQPERGQMRPSTFLALPDAPPRPAGIAPPVTGDAGLIAPD